VNNRGVVGKVVLCTEMERHEGKERERGGRRGGSFDSRILIGLSFRQWIQGFGFLNQL